MSPQEWAAILGIALAITSAFYGATRFIVKSIMRELLPNSGSSMRDQICRIEARLDHLYTVIVEEKR